MEGLVFCALVMFVLLFLVQELLQELVSSPKIKLRVLLIFVAVS